MQVIYQETTPGKTPGSRGSGCGGRQSGEFLQSSIEDMQAEGTGPQSNTWPPGFRSSLYWAKMTSVAHK